MGWRKTLICIAAVAGFFSAVWISPAFSNTSPPTPTQHFYGDADGDTLITTFDLGVLANYFNGQPYTFDTLQPQNPDQDWNTCDIDSDQHCTTFDLGIYTNFFNGQTVTIDDKPWVLQNVNLPLTGNAANMWIPFTINLYSTLPGPVRSGRPGVSVVAEIAPIGEGSTVTGQLAGRECVPVEGSRDQAAQVGAQCALSVTTTDWGIAPGTAFTESGTYGFRILANGSGDIMLRIRVEENSAMDITATTTSFVAHFPLPSGWYGLADSATGGGISNNTGTSMQPSIVIDSSNNPIVAWSDNSSGNYEIYIKRWNGSAWVEVGAGSASSGGISNNSGDSLNPSIAIDQSDNPVVAWYDNTSGHQEIYIKHWNGSNWVEFGAGSASGGGISYKGNDSLNPTLAIDASGNPVVGWQGNSFLSTYMIYVKRWNGSSWVALGEGVPAGCGFFEYSCTSPSLMVDNTGAPIVAFDDYGGFSSEIYVMRWAGSSWVLVGGGSASGGLGYSDSPSLALDSSGNPSVAWRNTSGNPSKYNIYIKRLNGTSWAEIGSGSASGGGISNNYGISDNPSLAFDPSGNPVVAWDHSSLNGIYIKRWNGSAWVEIGAGSASGFGISGSVGYSYLPSVALDSVGNPIVVWDVYLDGNDELYLKRWQP